MSTYVCDRSSNARRRRQHVARGALLLALAAPAGCKLAEVTVPSAEPRIVVHAVLDPFTNDEVVLVEQTLTGEVFVPDGGSFDAFDPIVTAGGVPITDALVILRDVDRGGEVTAVEDADVRPDGKGKGVYRIRNDVRGMVIRRGGRYELEVRWRGFTARARTTVPNPNEFMPQVIGTRSFNVDHDSLVLDWYDAEARRFVLLAETPYGPMRLFSPHDTLVVRGGLRNLFVDRFPPAFVPGFLETISTAAVDTNYFDYFRSFNNPFTGSGIINHVDGGVGVFGSIVPLDTRFLDVIADFDELPIEGRYVGGLNGNEVIDLYLGESLGGGARRVSGALRFDSQGSDARLPILGVTTGGNRLSLAILRRNRAVDTLTTVSGLADGDSLVIGVAGRSPSVYRRLASPATVAAREIARHIPRLAAPRRADAPRAAGVASTSHSRNTE